MSVFVNSWVLLRALIVAAFWFSPPAVAQHDTDAALASRMRALSLEGVRLGATWADLDHLELSRDRLKRLDSFQPPISSIETVLESSLSLGSTEVEISISLVGSLGEERVYRYMISYDNLSAEQMKRLESDITVALGPPNAIWEGEAVPPSMEREFYKVWGADPSPMPNARPFRGPRMKITKSLFPDRSGVLRNGFIIQMVDWSILPDRT